MTMAEILKKEARHEEKVAVAQMLLKAKSDIKFIARVTKLSISELEKIKEKLH